MESSTSEAVTEERLDLVEFLDDFIEAEAGVFRLSDWGRHSIVYSRPSPQHVKGLQENGYGLHILRHGRCTEDIHNYFRNYESHKCCLGLVGGQSIRTRLRLVKSDSLSQNSVDIGIDVTSPTSAYAAQVDLRLSDEEYRAFKCALWCAICPLLTAQKPPDDSSPPLTPSEHQREHDLEVQHHRKLSRSKTRHYSATLVESNIRDASLISSDIMREVLRRAFGLDRHLELYYMKLAYKFHKTKNDAQILAEDLCYQLSLLEKDAHPYYKSTSFLSQSAYNLWRLSKRRLIMELMSKFWNSTLPPVGDVEKFDARSIHSDYRLLLHKLLRQQKLQCCNDSGTLAFAVVPSGATRKILTEFSLRYGIDDLYHLTTYLEYLILNFEIEKEFINLVTETVQNISSVLPSEKATALLVRQQVEQLDSCINLLLHRCEHLFSHIQTVFASTNSCDSIDSLIHLLEKTVTLRDYLVMSDNTTSAGKLLQSYLEVNFQLIYIEHKTSALSDASNRGESSQLSPRVINRVMFCLRDDLADYYNNYQRVFERYFNITELSSIALYGFLMKDVLELCQQMRTQNETQKVNFGMIGLIYRLNALDNDLKEFIPVNRQTWRQACVDLVVRWFSALYRKGEYFILSAVGQDQFIPMHIPKKVLSSEEVAKCLSDNSASPSLLLRSRPSAFSVVNSSPHNEAENINPGNSDFASDPTNVETNVPFAVETQNSCAHTLNIAISRSDDAVNDSRSVNSELGESVCATNDAARETITENFGFRNAVVSGDELSTSAVAQCISAAADELPLENEVPFIRSSFCETASTSGDTRVHVPIANEPSAFAEGGSHFSSLAEPSGVASNALVLSAVNSPVKQEYNSTDKICADVCYVATQPANSDSEPNTVATTSDQSLCVESDSLKEQSSKSELVSNEFCEVTAEFCGSDVQSHFSRFRSLDADEQSNDVDERFKEDSEPSEALQPNDVDKGGSEVNLLGAGEHSAESREHSSSASEESNVIRKVTDDKEIASSKIYFPVVADDSLSSVSTGSVKSDGKDNDETRSSSCDNNGNSLPKLKLVGRLTEGEDIVPVTSSGVIPLPVSRPAHLLRTNELDSEYSDLKQSCPLPYGESLEHRSSSSPSEARNQSDAQSCESAARVYRRSENPRKAVILVTSSLVDVICLLQRLICVTETLGVALYRPALNASGPCGVDASEYKMDELWINLKKHLQKMIHNLVSLYAKNLMAMDLCAVSQKISMELIGSHLVQDLIKSRSSIWGCRHKLSGSDCLRYVNRHEEFRDSRHEPLSKGMCFRINNLLQLRKMLPTFFHKSAFCNVGDTSSFTVTEDYLNTAITGLINVLVYRMQLFVIDYLTQLVVSQLPSRAELEMTLQPLTGFLTSHLTSIKRWLCPENYSALLDQLWLSLSWCFEKCTRDVIRNPSPLSDQRADRLLQTVVIVMRFIVKLNLGNPDDIKVKHLDAVLFWLQLYSQPTHRLISIYQLLCLKKNIWNWNNSLPYGCDLSTFEKMRYDLHSSRKCFQGQQLIDWIESHKHCFLENDNQLRQNSDHIICESDDSIPSGIRERADRSPYDLAQAFLDSGAVLPLDFSGPLSCYSSSSIVSDPYPRLVFHGTVKQTRNSNTGSLEALVGCEEAVDGLCSQVPENNWFRANTQTLQKERGRSNSEGLNMKLPNITAVPSQQNCSVDARKTLLNGGTETVDSNLVASNGDICPAAQLSRDGTSEMAHEFSLDSSPVNVPASSLTFYTTGWYQIPSPSEEVTMIDPVEAMSQGRMRELHQCLQFFIGKRVKKEMILSIVASRKKNDELAKQFIQSLPRDVICKYPWLYVKEQTVLACLGLS